MKRYMLDTNVASYVIKASSDKLRQRVVQTPMNSLVISVVTEAELRYGVTLKGNPPTLSNLVQEFLRRVTVLPWETQTAEAYASLRASCTKAGITLGALDMMIAAHAIATQSILITHDKGFAPIPSTLLAQEDWTR